MSDFDLARQSFLDGVDCFEREEYSQAERHFRTSLALLPDRVSTMTNLAATLIRLKQFESARELSLRAIALDVQAAQAWLNMGLIEATSKQYRAAADCFARAIATGTQDAEAWAGQVEALYALGEHTEALVACEQYLRAAPGEARAWSDKSAVLNALARHEEALVACERAIQLEPEHALAWGNLYNILHDLRRYDDALSACDRALHILPDFAEMWSSRGNVLHDLCRYEEALAACDRALQLAPRHAAAWTNKGNALNALRRPDEALVAYEQALQCSPTHVTARWNMAITQLLLGDFSAGWRNYECRFDRPGGEVRRHTNIPPLTNLDDASGKRVLVWAEQGLGDTLEFSRYVPMLVERNAEVIFEVPALLKPLMDSLPDCTVVARGEQFTAPHYACPLLSLPFLFGTSNDNIPVPSPGLRASTEMLSAWRKKLSLAQGRLNIGIACSGNPLIRYNANRSIALEQFAPLLDIARLFLLQKDISETDRDFLSRHPEVVFVGDAIKNFADAAAIVECMDLVVSVDTSFAHLAGALGKPVRILLPWAPDWRWLLTGTTTDWYPSARLYRQSTMGDWQGVMRELRNDLLPPKA